MARKNGHARHISASSARPSSPRRASEGLDGAAQRRTSPAASRGTAPSRTPTGWRAGPRCAARAARGRPRADVELGDLADRRGGAEVVARTPASRRRARGRRRCASGRDLLHRGVVLGVLARAAPRSEQSRAPWPRHQRLEVAPADARGSAYLLAITSPCSVRRSSAVHAARRLGEDGLVARAAAAAHRAAAAVEEAQPHARLARTTATSSRCAPVELPVRREVAAVLVAVGVAEHHLLHAAASSDHRLRRRQRERSARIDLRRAPRDRRWSRTAARLQRRARAPRRGAHEPRLLQQHRRPRAGRDTRLGTWRSRSGGSTRRPSDAWTLRRLPRGCRAPLACSSRVGRERAIAAAAACASSASSSACARVLVRAPGSRRSTPRARAAAPRSTCLVHVGVLAQVDGPPGGSRRSRTARRSAAAGRRPASPRRRRRSDASIASRSAAKAAASAYGRPGPRPAVARRREPEAARRRRQPRVDARQRPPVGLVLAEGRAVAREASASASRTACGRAARGAATSTAPPRARAPRRGSASNAIVGLRARRRARASRR